ncbi:FeoB-associated Cys-rich membrane protein [Desulfosarcina sp.]|uniref:FeoB-associated Cys-rich membrane protein n=1 Tax=Desulfosarcina sp. TaxID=2027861 RepID=UPI003970863A
METLVVFLIVAVAGIYVGRIFYKGFKQKNGCACGCTCCASSDSCGEPTAAKSSDAPPAKTDR